MPRQAQIVCPICQRTLQETRFLIDKHNDITGRTQMCMDCMCTGIDNRAPSTFLHILQHFNKPYIESTWAKIANRTYQKNPMEFGPTSVIGKYLKAMNMNQFSNLSFADSDKCIADIKMTRPPQIERFWGKCDPIVLCDGEVTLTNAHEYTKSRLTEDEALQKRIDKSAYAIGTNSVTMQKLIEAGVVVGDNGATAGQNIITSEIKKAAQQLVDAQTQAQEKEREREEAREAEAAKPKNMVAGLDPALTQDNDAIVMNSLTKEDQAYLISKWGAYYTPSQWVKMERMYQEYAQEYELNIDRAETLKKICATSIKMDEALETGDVNGYKNLSAVYGQLRKDGKFTEAQNKAEVVRPFDTVGEIVRLCEDVGGPIPEWGDPEMYPQDQLDVILNDYKEYVYHLVKNEMGLGQIIERYVEKLEKAERDREDAVLKSLRGDLTAEDFDANAARMNLAEAIKREAEQLGYLDQAAYHTKMQNERNALLDSIEVVPDVT